MGAEAYHYVVKNNTDLHAALRELRQEVFESADFEGAEFGPQTPDEAMELSGAAGTSSILDISRISTEPSVRAASPLTEEQLEAWFPYAVTEAGVMMCDAFWDSIERGTARYIHLDNGRILFAGYSFD